MDIEIKNNSKYHIIEFKWLGIFFSISTFLRLRNKTFKSTLLVMNKFDKY